MDSNSGEPIACTLQPGDYRQRMVSIAELARSGLLGARRDDLRLELRYARDVAERVREMVRQEQSCCAFLDFELAETDADVLVTITAPERARDAADALFEPFVPAARSATSLVRQTVNSSWPSRLRVLRVRAVGPCSSATRVNLGES